MIMFHLMREDYCDKDSAKDTGCSGKPGIDFVGCECISYAEFRMKLP